MNKRRLLPALVMLTIGAALWAAVRAEVGVGKIWFCGEFSLPDDPEYGEPLAHVALHPGKVFRPVGDMVYGEIEELADEIHCHFMLDNSSGRMAHQLTMRLSYDLRIGERLPKNWRMADYERINHVGRRN